MTTTFHCTSCGRAIFSSDAILRRVTLSAFGGHRAEAYAIREAIDPDGLRRYDVSLHEGWYCCRFIMMRMTHDKFGTGDALLVYADSVTEAADGATRAVAKPHAAIRLDTFDHDAVIRSADNAGKLLVVKHGAIWCPPCRHMDAIIDRVVARGALPDVRFFELDIDHEPEIAARFDTGSIPFFVFYRDGKRLVLPELPGVRVIAGGIVGALSEKQLIAICQALAQPGVAAA